MKVTNQLINISFNLFATFTPTKEETYLVRECLKLYFYILSILDDKISLKE